MQTGSDVIAGGREVPAPARWRAARQLRHPDALHRHHTGTSRNIGCGMTSVMTGRAETGAVAA
jgi:hypothetical protein